MLNDLRFIIQQPFLFSLGSNINNRTKGAHTDLNENRASRALHASALHYTTASRLYYRLTYCTSPESGKAIRCICISNGCCLLGSFQAEGTRRQAAIALLNAESNLETENWSRTRGLLDGLKCYLDDTRALKQGEAVLSFSLRGSSRAHCDKEIRLMLPDLV